MTQARLTSPAEVSSFLAATRPTARRRTSCAVTSSAARSHPTCRTCRASATASTGCSPTPCSRDRRREKWLRRAQVRQQNPALDRLRAQADHRADRRRPAGRGAPVALSSARTGGSRPPDAANRSNSSAHAKRDQEAIRAYPSIVESPERPRGAPAPRRHLPAATAGTNSPTVSTGPRAARPTIPLAALRPRRPRPGRPCRRGAPDRAQGRRGRGRAGPERPEALGRLWSVA